MILEALTKYSTNQFRSHFLLKQQVYRLELLFCAFAGIVFWNGIIVKDKGDRIEGEGRG